MNMNVFHFDIEQSGAAGSIINAAKSLLLEQIQKPIQAMVQEVIGGKWKGQGAQRFAQEMSGVMNNAMNGMGSNLDEFNSARAKAEQILTQAESEATNIVGQIGGLFNDW